MAGRRRGAGGLRADGLGQRAGGAGPAAGRGAAGAARLEDVKRFLFRNNNVIPMVVLLLAGMKVLGNGLEQIGG